MQKWKKQQKREEKKINEENSSLVQGQEVWKAFHLNITIKCKRTQLLLSQRRSFTSHSFGECSEFCLGSGSGRGRNVELVHSLRRQVRTHTPLQRFEMCVSLVCLPFELAISSSHSLPHNVDSLARSLSTSFEEVFQISFLRTLPGRAS